jgi:SAM-dependent methyltransferase
MNALRPTPSERTSNTSHPVRALRQWAREISQLRRAVRIARALARPVAGTNNSIAVLASYPRFFAEFVDYRRIAAPNSTALEDIYPCLEDRTARTGFDAHYLYQAVWASSRIASKVPADHLDVGSDVRFVVNLTAHHNVTFLDIRPLEIELPRLQSIAASILSMPFDDLTQESVSCLHVAEHVGLGRYGDPIDPDGTRKACSELQRVVAPGGNLYFSLPVGRERTCFNAHRIHPASSVPKLFPELDLTEFSLVDDAGHYIVDTEVSAGDTPEFGCGLFLFRRPK